MVLDAAKEGSKNHREILEKELELVGLRLNKSPANISIVRKKTGGIKFNTMNCSLTKFGDDPERTVQTILQEYKMHNCEILFREDCEPDELIDLIEGNRKYVKCIYCYNKIDMITIEEVNELARLNHSTVLSCNLDLNKDGLIEMIWEYLALVRIYTKPRGKQPDFSEPVVLTKGRHGCTVKSACVQVHRSLTEDFKFAYVWGKSTKHQPQVVGLSHTLEDEDVVQIVKKSNQQIKTDRNYNLRVQAHWEDVREKRRKFRAKR